MVVGKRSRGPVKHPYSAPFPSLLTRVFAFLSLPTASEPPVQRQDVRPHSYITVDQVKVHALLDTGAEVSVLREDVFRRLPHRFPLRRAGPVRNASGKGMPVLGIANLPVTLGPRQTNIAFYIIPTMSSQCIIGADTMRKEKITINLHNRLIKFEDQTGRAVAASRRVVVPPFTEQRVPGKLLGPMAPETTTIEILGGNSEKVVVNAITHVDPITLQTTMVVQNPSNVPVEIKRGEILGTAGGWDSSREVNSIDQAIGFPGQKISSRNIQTSEVDLTKVPTEARTGYLQLLSKFSSIFSLNPNDVGHCTAVPQTIVLKDSRKVACIPPYRIPHHLLPVVQEYIHNLATAGIIQKSTSPFCSPLMLVKKAGASSNQPIVEQYRVVHDYRKLNENTVRDSYPMQNLYELLDAVAQAKVWSVVDLSSGFWNQELSKESRPLTAFSAPGMGHWEYTRSPQGAANSPAAFQRLLDLITNGLPGVHVYIDDVIVCADSHAEMTKRLGALFARFQKYNMKCRLHKLQLGSPEVNYLGYNISHAHGIRPGLAKTQAIREWDPPSSVTQIKQFLGLCSFFRRTIANFSTIASPLIKLTRKDAAWGGPTLPAEALKAFMTLKARLVSRPCLSPVDFSREFILTVDASSTGLGAILSQIGPDGVERPNAYASRTLNQYETKYAPFHLEHLAMVWACRHFHPYLLGKHFTLRTDHRPLLSLNNTRSKAIERLQAELQEFLPFTIVHLKGALMPADGLSRKTFEKGEIVSLLEIPGMTIDWEQLRHLQQQDVEAKALYCFLQNGTLPRNPHLQQFVLSQKSHISLFDGMVVLTPATSTAAPIAFAPKTLRPRILQHAHDSPLSGHFSGVKTLARISSTWFWPRMATETTNYCRSCHICQTANQPRHAKPAPLRPLPPPLAFNHRVHTDLLGPLPSSQGHKYLLVMQDAYSKWLELAPLPNKTADTVAHALFHHWVCRHGPMRTLNSDLGPEFANDLTRQLSIRFGITQVFSSAGHPASNGLVERANRSILAYFRKFLEGSNNWPSLLPPLQFAYNTAPHSSTGFSPFSAAFGRRPRLPGQYLYPTTETLRQDQHADEPLFQQIRAQALLRPEITRRLGHSFEQQKLYFDRLARSRRFPPGSIVYATRPHSGPQFQKFQLPFYGPFRVISEGQNGNCLLEPLPPNKAKVHPFWCHVNRLKWGTLREQIVEEPPTTKPNPELRQGVRRSPRLNKQMGAEPETADDENSPTPAGPAQAQARGGARPRPPPPRVQRMTPPRGPPPPQAQTPPRPVPSRGKLPPVQISPELARLLERDPLVSKDRLRQLVVSPDSPGQFHTPSQTPEASAPDPRSRRTAFTRAAERLKEMAPRVRGRGAGKTREPDRALEPEGDKRQEQSTEPAAEGTGAEADPSHPSQSWEGHPHQEEWR